MSELLKPRYKVIADFYQGQKDISQNRIKVGDIFMNYIPQQNIVWHRTRDEKMHVDCKIHKPEQYPHLFKPLAWYEEREASEMPEYVKNIIRPGMKDELYVYKVKKHFTQDCTRIDGKIREDKRHWVDENDLSYIYKHYEPATAAEYNECRNQYLKTKQK